MLVCNTLLLRGDDVAGKHRQHAAVHRHRHRHLIERNAVEQDLHVLDRIDRDTRLADVTDDARMVRVVTAMRREIERDRHSLATTGKDCGDRTHSILPRWKSPRTGGSSTGAPHTSSAAGRARKARSRGAYRRMGQPGQVGRRVERLDRQCRPASSTASLSSRTAGRALAAARSQSSSVGRDVALPRSGFAGPPAAPAPDSVESVLRSAFIRPPVNGLRTRPFYGLARPGASRAAHDGTRPRLQADRQKRRTCSSKSNRLLDVAQMPSVRNDGEFRIGEGTVDLSSNMRGAAPILLAPKDQRRDGAPGQEIARIDLR